uniref:Hexose transporter 1 n=1 Tax=Albugo laibachii Nc14 TaxID=890382 RepID=F0W3R4_9STRA|nr:Major Facilitator Superfamily (MFS) putative [Albugo laibachii Nc14]|eukprot:CCA15734.1 Major Facilitator Superfamily (MFS) putative [Albugo laibachii Nc14]
MTHENRGAYENLTTIGSASSETHLQDIRLDSTRVSAFGRKVDSFDSDGSNEMDELKGDKYEVDQKALSGLKSLDSRMSTRTTTLKSVREFQLDALGSFEDEYNGRAWMQCVISALSAISGFLFGYDLCVMVIALPLIQNTFSLSNIQSQSVVSILMIGAVFGSLFGGVGSDGIGRKPAIIVTAILFLIGSAVMTFAATFFQLLVGRFIVGLAVGSSGPCVSVYISEIARPNQRGALVTVNEVMLCIGCLASLVTSHLLQDSQEGWRKMLGATLLPPIIQLIGMPFLPESKRWLRAKMQTKQALEDEHEASLPDTRSVVSRNRVTLSFWNTVALLKLLFADQIGKRRILLSLMIAIGQTMTGASAILYYSTYILRSLDFDEAATSTSHFVSEITIGIAKLLGVCCAIILVDRAGRRRLLLFGSSIMLCSHLIFATSFWVVESYKYANQLHTFCLWNLYVFIFAWNFSWAPLMWVVCSEVLPTNARSIGMGITFAVFWLGSALFNYTILTLFDSIGFASTFFLYAVLTCLSTTMIYFKVPETTGLSYEKIDALFIPTCNN